MAGRTQLLRAHLRDVWEVAQEALWAGTQIAGVEIGCLRSLAKVAFLSLEVAKLAPPFDLGGVVDGLILSATDRVVCECSVRDANVRLCPDGGALRRDGAKEEHRVMKGWRGGRGRGRGQSDDSRGRWTVT